MPGPDAVRALGDRPVDADDPVRRGGDLRGPRPGRRPPRAAPAVLPPRAGAADGDGAGRARGPPARSGSSSSTCGTPTWPVPAEFDAILCRNVLLYFDEAERVPMLDRMAGRLRDGCWLAVGNCEILPDRPGCSASSPRRSIARWRRHEPRTPPRHGPVGRRPGRRRQRRRAPGAAGDHRAGAGLSRPAGVRPVRGGRRDAQDGPGGHRARRGHAADGRADVPAEADAAAPDAGDPLHRPPRARRWPGWSWAPSR